MAGELSSEAWLSSYTTTERLGQEIMERISQYHQELSKSSNKALGTATSVRTLMKKMSANTLSLKQSLVRSATQGIITVRESERRQALVDDLMSTEKKLEQAFSTRTTAAHNRNALLGNAAALGAASAAGNARGNPWLDAEETEQTRGISSDVIRGQHDRILQEQDRGLDALSKVVGRQREIAIDIAAEVDVHNDILGEISEEMERADGRLARESRNVKVILRKSRTHWCLWLLIVSLLIAIVVIAAVPQH